MNDLDFLTSARLLHRRLRASLEAVYGTIGHQGLKGDEGECEWIHMFESNLPRRYAARKGEIIDSRGARSEQIDVIIYDPQYTPLLFMQREAAYVPAEAVYAVFEVKPALTKQNFESAAKKAASVRRLHRTSAMIYHAGGTHDPRPPFPILAGILTHRNDLASADDKLLTLVQAHASDPETRLDLGCILDLGDFELDHETKRPIVRPSKQGLVHFLFRLLHRLQVLGTVPAIEWSAYAQWLAPATDKGEPDLT